MVSDGLMKIGDAKGWLFHDAYADGIAACYLALGVASCGVARGEGNADLRRRRVELMCFALHVI